MTATPAVATRYGAVFLGGMAGSLLRALLIEPVAADGFATSTLFVNALACFAIGALHASRERLHSALLLFAAVGFCGGLSTFSSFVADLHAWLLVGDPGRAMLVAALEIVVGLAAVLAGERLVRHTAIGTPGRR